MKIFKIFTYAVALLCLAPFFAIAADSNDKYFSNYVGQPYYKFMRDLGAPDALKRYYGPVWEICYDNYAYGGFKYRLKFAVLGHMVIQGQCERYDDFDDVYTPAATRGIADYMGKSRAELLALEGAPAYHTMFKSSDGYIYDDIIFKVTIDGEMWETSYNLEWNRVFALSYRYLNNIDGVDIPAFVAQKDAELVAALNAPVWLLRHFEGLPEDPEGFRHIRLLANNPYSGKIMVLANLNTNRMSFIYGVIDWSAKGLVGNAWAQGEVQYMLENWDREDNQWSARHGNPEVLRDWAAALELDLEER